MQTWNQNSNQVLEDSRKLALVQILQQPGATQGQAELPGMNLRRAELLPFCRKIEKLICEQELFQQQSAVLYWSSTDAAWLLPERTDQLALAKSTLACSVFSEHRQSQYDEFCFSLLGKELSVIVYGFGVETQGADQQYQCIVSFSSQHLKRVCQTMSPYWEFIDPIEADKLDCALTRLSDAQTSPHFINSLGHDWAQLKSPAANTVPALEQPASRSAKASANAGASSPSVDELQQHLANDYPYPIANPYRTLESITNASEKYKEQLRLIENLLALLAGLSMAISAQNEPAVLSELRDWISAGVSVGHWRELIRRCTVAWKGTSTKDLPLAKAISELRIELSEKGFGKAVEQLIKARNDFAHHRGPTAESEIEKDVIRLGNFLRETIKYTDFLCEYQIKIVKAIDVLPSGTIKMICLKASGDHPALRQEELCLNRGFPKGHLIANTGNSNWLSLYPFLTQDICSKCGTMEIYHLDRWKFEKNQMHLRSFERGHTQESSAISDSLKALISSINP